MGSNPVEALIFFRLLLSNCLNWKIYCDDHTSLSSTTAVQIWIISYIFHKEGIVIYSFYTWFSFLQHGSYLTNFCSLCQARRQQLIFFNQAWEICPQAWAGVRSKFSTRGRESWAWGVRVGRYSLEGIAVTRKYRGIQENTGEYRRIQGNTGEYRRIQENTGEYRRIQGNTGEYRRIQENIREYKGIQENTREYKRIQGNTEKYKRIQGNTKECITNTSKYREIENSV